MREAVYEENSNGISIDRIIRDYEYNMPAKHTHDEYEIYYLVEGERKFFIGTEYVNVNTGSLMFLNRNVMHMTSERNSNYHERIVVEFNENPFASFLAVTDELSLAEFFRNDSVMVNIKPHDQKKVIAHFDKIARLIKRKNSGHQLRVMAELAQLFFFALDVMSDSGISQDLSAGLTAPVKQRVNEVATYISDNYRNEHTLELLAKKFYINKSYLSRIFKQVTGHTVHEYLNVVRIRRAQEMLANTDMNINDLSEFLGYSSSTYFVKIFRKYTETTPLKYRKHNIRFKKPLRRKSFGAEDI